MIPGEREVRRPAHLVLAALVVALIVLAAVPALASAAAKEYFVNVTGIGPQNAGCEVEGSTEPCTLPAAIRLANENAGRDVIHFDPTVFQGAPPFATITLSSPLPEIEEEVEISAQDPQGEPCNTGWGVKGPCVEVALAATASTSILTVEAPEVTVEGIAFEGAGNGTEVAAGETGFTAVNDWFGVGLDRTHGSPNAAAGIRLEPGADGAAIGGPDPSERNVFSEGAFGLLVDGASSSTTEGNYFGLQPDGTFSSGHTLDVGVRIVDDTRGASLSEAVGNEVGGVLLGPEAASAECDGPCNVFAVGEEGADIDLSGFVGEDDSPATGPTRIRGNYLGLSPAGTAAIGGAEDAIYAGSAGGVEPGPGGVSIGGEDPVTEGNYLDKVEEFGIFAQSAADLEVLGNGFGILLDGTLTDPAGRIAIYAESEDLPEGALIAGNSIAPESGIGIESRFTGSEIVENEILGGRIGILAKEDDGGVENLIEGNELIEVGLAESGASIAVENDANVIAGNSVSEGEGIGILVEGEDFNDQNEANVVIGNTITEAGRVGILIGSNTNHNRVGGDAAGEANTILGSGFGMSTDPEEMETFGAITINSRQTGRNEVDANTGSGNLGAFVKLISHGGAEEPNGGIQPPAIVTALQSSASGTAEPGAVVRVFSKSSPEAGELGSLLAVATADSAGAWKVTFAKQLAGTLIAATQSAEIDKPGELPAPTGRGTSEVSASLAAVAEPEGETGGGGGTGGGSGGSSTPPSSGSTGTPITAPAPAVPKVKITRGPKKSSTATTAKFKFTATPAAGAKFECKLDGAKWAKCSSPKTYKKLKPGKHTFRVRAEAGGLTSAVVKYAFTVKI